jgi:hypothetical protein
MRRTLSIFGFGMLAACGGKFDDFENISPVVNQQVAFVFTPDDNSGGRLLLLSLGGQDTPCEGRNLDDTFTTACVLYDASDVQPGTLSSFTQDVSQITFSATRGDDTEVFVTDLAAPLAACASGEQPIGGACDVSLNVTGADLDPIFGVNPNGIEAAIFQGIFAQDTDLDGVIESFVTDLASSGLTSLPLTFNARLAANDLISLPSRPVFDQPNRRLLLSISDGADEGIFFLNLNGTPSQACDAADAILGACPLVNSAQQEKIAAPQPIVNRLYVLRQDGDVSQLVFVNADGSAPAECPAPTTAQDDACVVADAIGAPTFTDDGRFLLFAEADPEEGGLARLRLITLNGETPAACIAPFAKAGDVCVLDGAAGSLSAPGFLPLLPVP